SRAHSPQPPSLVAAGRSGRSPAVPPVSAPNLASVLQCRDSCPGASPQSDVLSTPRGSGPGVTAPDAGAQSRTGAGDDAWHSGSALATAPLATHSPPCGRGSGGVVSAHPGSRPPRFSVARSCGRQRGTVASTAAPGCPGSGGFWSLTA